MLQKYKRICLIMGCCLGSHCTWCIICRILTALPLGDVKACGFPVDVTSVPERMFRPKASWPESCVPSYCTRETDCRLAWALCPWNDSSAFSSTFTGRTFSQVIAPGALMTSTVSISLPGPDPETLSGLHPVPQ